MIKKIDAHQHFWNYDKEKHNWIDESMSVLQQDFLPSDLKSHLDEKNIDACVAVQADQTEEETDFLLSLADRYSYIAGVVGWLDIKSPDFGEALENYSSYEKLKGLRHVVQDEPDDFLLQSDFCRGISLIKEYNLTYDILIYEHQLPAAVKFVEKFPDQPFVLDHIAKPRIKEGEMESWKQGIIELAQHPKVYCKISGMVTEADWKNWQKKDFRPYLDVIFEVFGADRLMFGSDWPVCTLAADYSEVYSIIHEYISSYSAEKQEMILGGTAQQFYGL
ncbi:amidohydrolase family protein [Aliifodinibius salicampi]|uniref:Amidohydrolase family protein n=1 Tax=Fodinibius salicampi TaxID=1920655 RepID=A0ABT3PZN9_9BACT|nr:amidohydrolase family protein [Fodinibius salicampi]MCW9713301.1 amidohydrolase family protein [Fodinibius salicampi]